ncbi:Ig-like domain-containing protein [Microbacterium koreense]|uniref:Ig-like domain-containing protein n=1 Tax=Microbacterium koreense TaxID=323761 RepID=A0ABW2ZM40_9MICO
MRRRTLAGLVAASGAVALITTISIVWPGLDAQETPPVDEAVWALRTGDGRQYARVNTAVGELDTVRSVSNPDRVVHTEDAAYIFSDSLSTLTRIDEAQPEDLDEEVLSRSTSTPAGTVEVVTAGDFVGYRTDVGGVFAGRLSGDAPIQVDPDAADEDAPAYEADAIAVDDRGILFAYSEDDAAVLRYDVATSTVVARDAVAVDGMTPDAITAAGDTWVLVDSGAGTMLRRGDDATQPIPDVGAVRAGEADAGGDAVYLAGPGGLVRVPADGSPSEVQFSVGTSTLGAPARPIVADGVVYAAWVGLGDSGGWLWSSEDPPVTLDYGGSELGDQRRPTFVEGHGTVVLNESRSGWVWEVPDGTLVASSQDWSLDDRVESEAIPSDEQLEVMLDPKPPVAEPDVFGVRAGALTTLAPLLNDHDPNEDVLMIDPASITGLDPEFGTVAITDHGQRLALRVAPGVTGSATFSYAVTDGTSSAGLRSPPATVTVTVVPDEQNAAPQWCATEGCLVEWPRPEVARGGTVTVPILQGWVDPEGDPLLLESIENLSGEGSVAATPAGEVVFQHDDDGSGAEQVVELVASVADTKGATTTRSLVIRVTAQPAVEMESFAVVDVLGAGITVDVADHVTGTLGRLIVDSVRVLDDAAATATVVAGTTAFDFSPAEAGEFRVDVTVTDGESEATGTVRITVLPADAPAELATSPVVAFVHPQEDATIDVLSAVSNPTRRVLLLSDVRPTAAAGASLSVDAVAQNHLRVSGSTPDGAPGPLGTVRYTVSDGSEDAGAAVQGEATVYLLPPAPALAPIAVDDTVTVRAGAQVDIPVLENDVAPAGGRPLLDPSLVSSSTPDALAFAADDVVRYLAPDEPGDYEIGYGIFATGSPALADTATVRVRVLDDEENRAPVPETLEGRVLSGQTTVIDVDGFGRDPDGDVVTLDRIVTQPERGAATLSADGASIVYTSVPGDRGQVSFTYRLIDQFGDEGEGLVRVGVLDAESNPSPVTYTDYVHVQLGADNTIRVAPLANDVDPVGGELQLREVRPDVAATLDDGQPNPEYERLADRILFSDDNEVEFAAGADARTMAFLYDLESSSGNTARGRIVVKVVRENVPDYPVVADTILTAETREDFPDGVDVLSGKVAWSGGDVDSLDLRLWGLQRGVEVDGWTVSGALGADSRIVPLEVSGTGSSGEVTTYAFLRIPGEDDITLALRRAASAPEVTELESVTFDMIDLVAVPRGATLLVGGDIEPSGARSEATCALETDTTVRYDAGSGAPWVDSCRVPVRLDGQDEWTYLSVPIVVQAREPQPILRAGSVTAGPGETITHDLRTMTTWQLRDDWDGLAYDIDYGGTSFEVSLDGSLVTVTGADRAVPGTDEAATISITSHGDVAPVRLILRVGAAPSTLPQGGVAAQQCSQASGSSCTVTVIGAAGEVNPLPRTPLEVVDVADAGSCVGVTFSRASATTITASWTADAPGATCTAAFSVRDAQGRIANGDRRGSLLLDLQGYPKAPASLTQVGYGDGSLTLGVDPGNARAAYPALTEFVVLADGVEVVRCAADGTCPPIASANGEKRTFDVFAVNAVGRSQTSVRTVAWAYDVPEAPTAVTAQPVVTAGQGGVVSLVIEGVDAAETGTLEISSASGDTVRIPVRPGQTTIEVPSYRVGANTRSLISVTPYSRFDVPSGPSGSPTGTSVTAWGNGIGAPLSPSLALSATSNGDGTSTVQARASAQLNGDGSALRYGIVRQGQTCTVQAAGADATFTGLTDGEVYTFTVCVESIASGTSYGRATADAGVRAVQSGRAPTGYTFAVDATPDVFADRAQWVIRQQPQSPETPPNRNSAVFDRWPSAVIGSDPGITVRYVHDIWGTSSAPAAVVPRSGSAPYALGATWSVSSCVGDATLRTSGGSSNLPDGTTAAVTFDPAGLRYFDANGTLIPHDAGTWTVPATAVRVEGVGVRASWGGAFGLADATATLAPATCTPTAEPEIQP